MWAAKRGVLCCGWLSSILSWVCVLLLHGKLSTAFSNVVLSEYGWERDWRNEESGDKDDLVRGRGVGFNFFSSFFSLSKYVLLTWASSF